MAVRCVMLVIVLVIIGFVFYTFDHWSHASSYQQVLRRGIRSLVARPTECRARALIQTLHVPDEYLEQFNLNAFILAPDYLYIENEQGDVVFSGAVQCQEVESNKCNFIEVHGGPKFLSRVQVHDVNGTRRLITDDLELVAVLQSIE